MDLNEKGQDSSCHLNWQLNLNSMDSRPLKNHDDNLIIIKEEERTHIWSLFSYAQEFNSYGFCFNYKTNTRWRHMNSIFILIILIIVNNIGVSIFYFILIYYKFNLYS